MPNQRTAVMTGTTKRYGSRASAGPGHFQIGTVRRHRLEALRGVPAVGAPGCHRRSASEAGPYTIRVRVPHGVKLMPHRHQRIESTGDFRRFLHRPGRSVRPGTSWRHIRPEASVVLPGNTSHFHWAKSSEYITQVTAIGPLGLEYVSARTTIQETTPRSRCDLHLPRGNTWHEMRAKLSHDRYR